MFPKQRDVLGDYSSGALHLVNTRGGGVRLATGAAAQLSSALNQPFLDV